MPISNLKEVATTLTHNGYKVKFYDRGSQYSSNDLITSQAVVVILHDLQFQMEFSKLSKGVASEIDLALNNDIPLYVVYKPTSSDHLMIYNAKMDGSRFRGVSGTGDDFFDQISPQNECSDESLTGSEAKDKRLLLS